MGKTVWSEGNSRGRNAVLQIGSQAWRAKRPALILGLAIDGRCKISALRYVPRLCLKMEGLKSKGPKSNVMSFGSAFVSRFLLWNFIPCAWNLSGRLL